MKNSFRAAAKARDKIFGLDDLILDFFRLFDLHLLRPGQLGLKHMVCSGGLMAKTTDEAKKRGQQMNHFREMVKKGGIIAGYHNHNGEFDEKLDGRPQ